MSSLLSTACSSKNNTTVSENKSINSDTAQLDAGSVAATALAERAALENVDAEEENFADLSDLEIPADIDVTSLSATMVAAELFNVQRNMPEYVGKTIRIQGQYYESYDAYNERPLHIIYAMDEGGCCPIEFEIKFPDGVTQPKQDDKIEIFGEISSDTQMSQGSESSYYYIKASEVKNLSA